MTEYKVIEVQVLRNRASECITKEVNRHAREGWRVSSVSAPGPVKFGQVLTWVYVTMEREVAA